MTTKESIVSEIFRDISFSKEEIALIDMKFEKMSIKKGTVLLQKDEVVLDQYFVYDGCLRTYFLDNHGKEHTLQFAIKDWWISDFTSFFSGNEAIMNIECIQSGTLYKISRKNTERLYKEIPVVETFFRKKMERAFSSFQKRILANLAQSAKERYVTFIQKYPTIEQSVKNYHIASYLGITTESLSRIRKEISQQ